MESTGWTEERVELLKKLWLEGLSASQIAGVLGEGVTRNAVIGKVHRLKLTGRAKPASSAPRARTAPRAPSVRRISTGPSRPSSGIASMMKSRSMPAAPMHGATALKMDPEFETEAYVAPQVQELYIPEDQRHRLLHGPERMPRVDPGRQVRLEPRYRPGRGDVGDRLGDERVDRRCHVAGRLRRRHVPGEHRGGGHQHGRGVGRIRGRLLDHRPEALHRGQTGGLQPVDRRRGRHRCRGGGGCNPRRRPHVRAVR